MARTFVDILIGTDIIEIKRVRNALEKPSGEAFKNKVFTKVEQQYCEEKRIAKYHSYACSFAAKEAVAKAFGTGIGANAGLSEIEVRRKESGKPYIELYGKAKQFFESIGGISIKLSLSHCESYAQAFVVVIIGDNSVDG